MTEQRSGASPDRRRRRFWFDPRFAIGLALVVASVAGVVGIVAANDSSTPVLVPREALTPGQLVTEEDFTSASLRADGAEPNYLRPSDLPSAGAVVTRVVGAGELVPRAALGSAASLQLSSVVVPLDARLPASIGPGSSVDVWASREEESGGFGAPVVLVPSATVVRLVAEEGIVVGGGEAAVEVLVPRESTARVLEAVANEAAISVVPVDLPLGG